MPFYKFRIETIEEKGNQTITTQTFGVIKSKDPMEAFKSIKEDVEVQKLLGKKSSIKDLEKIED